MSAILDLLYREYCRARLAEMRKQLLLLPGSHEVPEANCDVDDPEGARRSRDAEQCQDTEAYARTK